MSVLIDVATLLFMDAVRGVVNRQLSVCIVDPQLLVTFDEQLQLLVTSESITEKLHTLK